MASKYLQKYPVPTGFQQIISDFTRQVLRDQPQNIIEYGAKYFEMLEQGKKFEFDSKNNVKKDDKKYELGFNPKAAEDMTKKASNIATSIQNQTQVKQQKQQNKEEPAVEKQQSAEAEERIKRQFDRMDENKNGFIESSEVRNYLEKVMALFDRNAQVPEEAVQQWISQIDTNKDGKVSREEFYLFAKQYA